VATLYPDLVLRHVMPVFTFMGASTIRHDDNYTFTVMQKSLRAILPSMVKQGGIGVSDVLRIFVDNFQHVPLHRRLHLFASVLQTLSLKYLPDLLLLFLVKHITQVPLLPEYLQLPPPSGSHTLTFSFTLLHRQGPQEQTQKKLDQSVSIDESDLVDLEVSHRLLVPATQLDVLLNLICALRQKTGGDDHPWLLPQPVREGARRGPVLGFRASRGDHHRQPRGEDLRHRQVLR